MRIRPLLLLRHALSEDTHGTDLSMDATLLASFIGFAFIASVTPGPNNLLLMSSGALFGWRRTLPHLAGIMLGFATVMTAAALGLGTLVEAWPWLMTIVKLSGATWLAWLSIRFFRAGIAGGQRATADRAPISRPFRFYEAVIFQWINPKGLIAAISSAGAYIAIADSLLLRTLLLVGVFVVTGLISCSTWMVAGEALNRYMATGRSAVYVNLAMGVLIVLTAVIILLA